MEGPINECVDILTLTLQATERFIIYFTFIVTAYKGIYTNNGYIHKGWARRRQEDILCCYHTMFYFISYNIVLLYLCILLF